MDRGDAVFAVRLAEQAGRPADMVAGMKKIVAFGDELDATERHLLQSAFKGTICASREALQRLLAISTAGRTELPWVAVHARYKAAIEDEIRTACDEALELAEQCLGQATTVEARVFFLLFKGDFNRYLAELQPRKSIAGSSICAPVLDVEELDMRKENALLAYRAGASEARRLPVTSSLRLGMALNRAVFHREILGSVSQGYEIANEALRAALLEYKPGDSPEDCLTASLLQLLRANIMAWEKEL